MVLEKDRLLTGIGKAERRVGGCQRLSSRGGDEEFPSTPEYSCLATLFMNAGGDQQTERMKIVHPKWDLSFLMHEVSQPSLVPPASQSKVLLSLLLKYNLLRPFRT
ncbi:hypothetical protein Adt_31375 [Abeliophyllum distichum]|uniref:Uncharacterized protein n=1 Tax=Abeliophyllum distichum TaxID=126358 RepID=A0ABD1RDW7_9LAMI